MSKLFSTDQLKAVLKAGAKADRFSIRFMGTPNSSTNLLENEYALCKSVSFPERNLGAIEVYVHGRKLILSGNTEFGSNEITVNIYNDSSLTLRDKFLRLQDEYDKFTGSTNWARVDDYWSYFFTTELCQIGQDDGGELRKYLLKDCFPKRVGPIQMDASQINTITTFDLTLGFTWMEW